MSKLPLRCAFLIFLPVVGWTASRAEAGTPTVFILDGAHLVQVRQQVQHDPGRHATALRAIRSNGTKALTAGPWSVMDKDFVPPSGDKHDYYSVGPYWWPDPSKPDGLPYVRRDGETNPERNRFDNSGLKATVSAVQDLALAWFFTDDPRYAERAALLLRTWFLDPATKMNPHLQYGQAIPGRTEGRGIGIIDTASLVYLIDAVGLLQTSEAWTDAEHQTLQSWFRAYLDWLLTSTHGKEEGRTKNNHAVWYDVQLASFALFVGDEAVARRILEQAGPNRIATQIEPDGRMPQELARTKSFGYTHMNLRGFLHLARLAEHVEVDLWHFRTDDGRSIEAALNWFEPFVAGRAKWTHPQITAFDPKDASLLYRRASQKLDKSAYRQLGSTIKDPLDVLLWEAARADR
jgi:hypothetical protein